MCLHTFGISMRHIYMPHHRSEHLYFIGNHSMPELESQKQGEDDYNLHCY